MDVFPAKKRSWIMSQVKANGNRSTEVRLIAILRENGITGWRRQYPLDGKPAFVFPRARVVVFVDGCFWHGHPKRCRIPKTNREYWHRKIASNVTRDRRITRALQKKGWKVVRIWEDSVQKTSALTRLRKALT